jgi:hypothetical protein
MTWICHKLTTGSVIFALTGNPVAAVFAAAGSIIPDALEGFPSNEGDYARWRKNHRRFTHWFVPYAIAAIAFYCVAYSYGIKSMWGFSVLKSLRFDIPISALYGLIAYAFAFIVIGALMHCLQDACCGSVPSLNPMRRIGLRLFYVGSLKEYAIVFPLSVILILARLSF